MKAFVGYFERDHVFWHVEDENGEVFHSAKWKRDGRSCGFDSDTIVAEWDEPKRINGWVNIYPGLNRTFTSSVGYETRNQADLFRW